MEHIVTGIGITTLYLLAALLFAMLVWYLWKEAGAANDRR
jgi:hypothetical protein